MGLLENTLKEKRKANVELAFERAKNAFMAIASKEVLKAVSEGAEPFSLDTNEAICKGDITLAINSAVNDAERMNDNTSTRYQPVLAIQE